MNFQDIPERVVDNFKDDRRLVNANVLIIWCKI